MAHLPQVVIASDVGDWLLGKTQGLWRIDRCSWRRLAVDQPVQDVEYMGLGGYATLQRQLDRAQYRLFVMVQDKGQDLDPERVRTERTSGVAHHPGFKLDMAKIDRLQHPAAQNGHHTLPGEQLVADEVAHNLLPGGVWRTGQSWNA